MPGNNPNSPDNGGDDGNEPATEQHPIGTALQSLERYFDTARKNPTEYERESHTWSIRTGRGVIVYTIFTAVIMIAAVFTAFYSRWQASTADDSEKRDLRAYVYLDTKTIPYPRNAPNRFAISLNIKNSGKTWARKLIMINKVVPDAKGDPFDALQWGDEATAPAVLGPDQTWSLQFGEIPFGDVPDIADRKKVYDYVVWIKYLDTVSRTPVVWQTQMSLHLIGDREGTPGHLSFGFNPTHNCADDDCN